MYLTAGSDYVGGEYTVRFSAGDKSATLMVYTRIDDTVELPEYFIVMITSVDRPELVVIGSPNTSVITIDDNNGALHLLC